MANTTVTQRETGTSWTGLAALPAAVRAALGTYSSSKYGRLLMVVGGNTGSAVTTNYQFDQSSWSTKTALGAARYEGMAAESNLKYYYFGGFDAVDAESGTTQSWNGSGWTSITAVTTASTSGSSVGCAPRRSWFTLLGSTAGVVNTAFETNASDATSAITASTAALSKRSGAFLNNKIYTTGGSTDGAAANGVAANYAWNYAAWSTEAAMPTVRSSASSPFSSSGFSIIAGSNAAGKVAINVFYNGASWSTNKPSIATATAQASAGAC